MVRTRVGLGGWSESWSWESEQSKELGVKPRVKVKSGVEPGVKAREQCQSSEQGRRAGVCHGSRPGTVACTDSFLELPPCLNSAPAPIRDPGGCCQSGLPGGHFRGALSARAQSAWITILPPLLAGRVDGSDTGTLQTWGSGHTGNAEH